MDTKLDEFSRQKIPARLDRQLIARAVAEVVKAILAAVETEQDDFWVNVDLDIHVREGKAHEKLARVNVYGDFPEAGGDDSKELNDENEVPSEVFRSFCEPAE